MTRLTEREPDHWHTPGGGHAMRDPRRIDGYPPQSWTADERAYVEHLLAHWHALHDPQPEDDDPEAVRRVFELLAIHQDIVVLLRELITSLRHQARRNTDPGASP
ncbi:hypothetical protein [Streptomyces millisiae]|uniref:Uncharacterized protein n=1 Tax=Streptomyces millisiae TaxID=3075542 RepID=A0ABU2LN84_9ACTN|nr:hypothetical protein [Streptomyces sp. DSM 44918]MDT0318523.1 hypothetical protein [Streptomyces sp. DSM 44918]